MGGMGMALPPPMMARGPPPRGPPPPRGSVRTPGNSNRMQHRAAQGPPPREPPGGPPPRGPPADINSITSSRGVTQDIGQEARQMREERRVRRELERLEERRKKHFPVGSEVLVCVPKERDPVPQDIISDSEDDEPCQVIILTGRIIDMKERRPGVASYTIESESGLLKRVPRERIKARM